jgi:hypothetical protein
MPTLMKLALTLYCAVLAVSVQAAEEVKTIKLAEDVTLEFKAENVGAEKKRDLNLAGYVIYKGELYQSVFDPPHLVLTSGHITIAGKRIELDVSGLAEPWVTGDKFHRRFVRLDRSSEERGVLTLTVVFAKGGAEDYSVEWDIFRGKSMRIRIEGCGDTYPEWVSPAAEEKKR